MILDTGNDVSVGNGALRRLLSIRRPASPETYRKVALIDVNGNTTQLDTRIVDQLRIASLNFKNVPIGFADARVFEVLGLREQPALLLGMDVLRLFERVSIDFGNRRVRFQFAEGSSAQAKIGATEGAARVAMEN